MQNNDYVYFLSVKQARAIAKRHESDENWDLWNASEVEEYKLACLFRDFFRELTSVTAQFARVATEVAR